MVTVLSSYFFIHPVYAGIYQLPHPWSDKNQITVCFAHKDDHSSALAYTVDGVLVKDRSELSAWPIELKSTLKNIITDEYSQKRTGVDFIGWNDCTNSTNLEVVRLFLSAEIVKNPNSEYGRASIGPNLQYHLDIAENKAPFLYIQHPKAMQNDFNLKKRFGNLEKYWKTVAVHEFGHLTGLLHEHEQPGISKDPNCVTLFKEHITEIEKENLRFSNITIREFIDNDYGADPHPPRVQHGPYDSQSVMNYCYVNKNRDQSNPEEKDYIGLSEQDQATLKEAYEPLP